jgi:coenzyme F420-0:L-glutamate ligase/coenzyme F420-1:gamma-L-glutamate ligase
MINDLQAFLRSRRSIHTFKPDPISIDIIQRILETAIHAPSAHNLQPWRFVVVTSTEVKSRLAGAFTRKFQQDMISEGIPEPDIQVRARKTIRRIMEAPAIIVLCHESTKVKAEPNPVLQQAEAFMGVQSVALAGLQLLLAAHAEGLGGTWICWPLFATDETCQALELESNWVPQGMIFLGYPAEIPVMPTRIPLQKVTRYL